MAAWWCVERRPSPPCTGHHGYVRRPMHGPTDASRAQCGAGKSLPLAARPFVSPRSSMADQHGGRCWSLYPVLHRLSCRHTCPATLPMVGIDARNCYRLACNWPQSWELPGYDAPYWSSAVCTKPRWHLSPARGVRVVCASLPF